MTSLPLMDEKLLRYMNIGINSGIANATNSTIAPPSSRQRCLEIFCRKERASLFDWGNPALFDWGNPALFG
jgi:hypothetical protein